MDEQSYIMEDEIDLRELVLTLLQGWKTILAVTLLAGAAAFGFSKLQPEVYEAQTYLAVDAKALKLSIAPESLLLSDHVRELAAEEAGMAAADMPQPVLGDGEELPSITVTPEGESRTIFALTVRGEDAVYVRDAASAWGEAGVLAVNELVNPYLEQEAESYEELAEADRALLQYLEGEGLASWSWTDLALLTGFGEQPSILLSQGLQYGSGDGAVYSAGELPAVSVDQRGEIIRLMRARADAEMSYVLIREQAEAVGYALATSPPRVLNQPVLPESPVEPQTLRNTSFGIVLGGMAGVMLVFVLDWFREPEETENG